MTLLTLIPALAIACPVAVIVSKADAYRQDEAQYPQPLTPET